MEPTNWRARFDVGINIAVLLAAFFMLAVLARNLTARTDNMPVGSDLKRGSTLSPLRGIDLARSEETLVLFLNTQCRYCERSTPFYAQLAEIQRRSSKRIQVVAVFSNPRDESADFMSKHQLTFPIVPDADYSDLQVPVTPSIALINQKLTILDSWTGELTPSNQQHIFGLFK